MTSAGVVGNFALPAFSFIIQVVILWFIERDFIENYQLWRAGADDMLKQKKIFRRLLSKYILLTTYFIKNNFPAEKNWSIVSSVHSLSHRLFSRYGGEASKP